MDFVRSNFGKMKLWPVEYFFEHICHHFWVGLLLLQFHLSEVTSYKIHTLESPSANQENKKKIINHLFYWQWTSFMFHAFFTKGKLYVKKTLSNPLLNSHTFEAHGWKNKKNEFRTSVTFYENTQMKAAACWSG